MTASVLLRLIREARGASQADFAGLLGVRQSALSKYESGRLALTESVFEKLSALGYRKDFFSQASGELTSGLVFHRKRKTLPVKLCSKIEARMRLRALDVLNLAKRQPITSQLIERQGRTPEEMAAALRQAWVVPEGPIDNVCALLEQHGIPIVKTSFGTPQLDAFVLPLEQDLICIALNADLDYSPDRQRHSLCHELGHALLHLNEAPGEQCEKEADRFAAALLFPEKDLVAAIQGPITLNLLYQLKTRWKVSVASILHRLMALEIISQARYRQWQIFLSANGLRKQEPTCGVKTESPTLIAARLNALVAQGQDLASSLHLTPEGLYERYPQLTPEGAVS